MNHLLEMIIITIIALTACGELKRRWWAPTDTCPQHRVRPKSKSVSVFVGVRGGRGKQIKCSGKVQRKPETAAETTAREQSDSEEESSPCMDESSQDGVREVSEDDADNGSSAEQQEEFEERLAENMKRKAEKRKMHSNDDRPIERHEDLATDSAVRQKRKVKLVSKKDVVAQVSSPVGSSHQEARASSVKGRDVADADPPESPQEATLARARAAVLEAFRTKKGTTSEKPKTEAPKLEKPKAVQAMLREKLEALKR